MQEDTRNREGLRDVPTFARWLQDTTEPETHPIGWLRLRWAEAEGRRPRVSTPAGIEKFLAEALDETMHGQVNTAIRQAKDAYQHRDDPSWSAAPEAAAAGLELASGAYTISSDQLTEMQADAVERLEGDPYGDAERLRLEMAEAAAGAGVPFPPEPSMREVWIELVAQRQQADRMWALVRSMAAVMGLNVDDDSIGAMAELWDAAPDAAESITAQLANGSDPTQEQLEENLRLRSMGPQIDPATGQDRRFQGISPAELYPDGVPHPFAEWFGMADHDAQASDG